MSPQAARTKAHAPQTAGGGGSARPSWIVIPALNEAVHIEAAIQALGVAAQRAPAPVHVVVVDDGSTDATGELASAALARWGSGHTVLAGPRSGVGWARRVGFELALAQAAEGTRNDASNARTPIPLSATALIATTDADTRVEPDWLEILHALLDEGACVIAGDVHLETTADERLAAARALRLQDRLLALRWLDPLAEHPHFAGSNLAFSAEALGQLGPLPTPESLEDEAIAQRCTDLNIPVLRHGGPRVITSPRTLGRAPRGLADALARDAALMVAEPH